MTAIPEGAKTAEGEGRDLATAIKAVADTLGIEPTHVGYKLDMNHFRSNTGASKAVHTVKIIGWEQEPSEDRLAIIADNAKSAPRKPRRSRDDDDRRGNDAENDSGNRVKDAAKAAEEAVADLDTTEASEFARVWMEALLGHMDLKGTVKTGQSDDGLQIVVAELDKAGRLIGKRGSTLRSVRRILELAIENKFEALEVEVDIADSRGRKDDRKRDRNDDRKRGGGGRDRKRRDDRRGGGGKFPEDKLRALARRAAEKALETGKAVTINAELNSYDRRIVHIEVAEVEGVMSQSEERDGKKVVQVIPELLEA